MPPVKHSYFGASSSERWITCPGSVTLCAKAPKTGGSSSFANEGTAAHELAEKSLLSRRMPINFYGETILVEGTAFVVDNEMVEAVTMYVNEVLKVASKSTTPVFVIPITSRPSSISGGSLVGTICSGRAMPAFLTRLIEPSMFSISSMAQESPCMPRTTRS